MKIIVGMSGGVDSSVTALLLKQAGYDVTGVTMSIWRSDLSHNNGNKDACYGPNEKQDIEEAKKVCKQLDIPFYVLDCVDKYEKIVLENFRKEYIAGRTPNPCIWCNSQIKFGTLPQFARESGIRFEKFATGHYARISYDEENNYYNLKRAVDIRKDQTYFLYRLSQKQLSETLFPLGDYPKEDVRRIAVKNGLHVAEKEDSQDFYSGDYNELLKVGGKQGNIIDKDGCILGQHTGIWNYTIGQRKGIGIAARKPLYVIDLNEETNEVIVGHEEETYSKSLIASDINWISLIKPETGLEIKAKIRSSQSLKDALIKEIFEDKICIEFNEEQKAVAPGQSVVFYFDDTVLGGGIIS